MGADASLMLTLTRIEQACPSSEAIISTLLSPFASMIASAARLPLIPVADWTTRAANSLNAGAIEGAVLVSLIDPLTHTLVHAGAACSAQSQPSKVVLLSHAEDLMKLGRTHAITNAHWVQWTDNANHPFQNAGLPFGAVIRCGAAVSDRMILSVHVYRATPSHRDVELAMIDGVTDFLVQSLRTFATRESLQWLSARESDVLDLIVVGYSVNEIAAVLGRSPHTVHDHLKAIHRKTGASSRGQLIAAATGRRAVEHKSSVA